MTKIKATIIAMVLKIRRTYVVLCLGLLILRSCGPQIFLSKMTHQLYGHTIFLGMKNELDTPRPPSSFQCATRLATPDDVKELFGNFYHESPEGRYQLLVRKWYHERGLGDCYITRTKDTNEICMVQWLVTPEHVYKLGWEDRFPLSEDEVMIENQYTLERYRRQGVRTAVSPHIRKIAMQRGFISNKGYTDEANMPQHKWYEKLDDEVCERILERHFLFRITRKTLEKYDPPVSITALPNIK